MYMNKSNVTIMRIAMPPNTPPTMGPTCARVEDDSELYAKLDGEEMETALLELGMDGEDANEDVVY